MNMINQIRKRIVEALERGEDTTPLEEDLREARLREMGQTEIDNLRQTAEKRQAFRTAAADIQEKVQRQGTAVDKFIKERDKILPDFDSVMSRIQALQDTFEEADYVSATRFRSEVSKIPKEFLPAGFTLPSIGNNSGAGPEMVKQCLYFLDLARKVFAGAVRYDIQSLGNLAYDEGLGLDDGAGSHGADDGQADETAAGCLVCRHPDRESIENALVKGVSLRDLERQYQISRSTLSRHKGHV